MEKIQNEAVIFRGGINGEIVGSFRPADLPALTEKRSDSSQTFLLWDYQAWPWKEI